MSDLEGQYLQTAPSICSDVTDQDFLAGIRSISSIDFHHKSHKARMNRENSHQGFMPGQQRPPHHRHGYSGQQDYAPPPAPERRKPPPQQQRFEMSESPSQSGDTASPRKDTSDIPVFSVLQRNEDDEGRGILEQGFNNEQDQTPVKKAKRSRSKDHKKRSRRVKETEHLQNQDAIASQKSGSYPEQQFHFQMSERKSRTHTVGRGTENPAYESEDAYAVNENTQSQKEIRISNKSIKRVDTGVEDEIDDENVDKKVRRIHTVSKEDASVRHMDSTVSSQKSIPLHAATVVNSAMTPKTKKITNQSYCAWYISSNIQQRECCVYARNRKSPDNDCQCGRPIEWHEEKELKVDLGTERVMWHSKTHTEVMPCDSFGEILFQGFGIQTANSPYMRVDSTCSMDKVWTVLTDCWQLPMPRLIISVTGGAKRFYLRPRLQNILKQGLVNAAVSTGAWIITGGSAAGVMEFVGEAIQDYCMASSNPDEKCVALGIASWGTVANNIALDGEGERGLFPATYCMEDIKDAKKAAPLDCNHTHFLLVDNGTQNQFGVEIEFRSRLEDHISRIVETGVAENQSINVPTVLIVVEGGLNTMKTVMESMSHGTPVVIIDGSGRAADYFSFAYRLTRDPNDEERTINIPDFDDIMRRKAERMFAWRPDVQQTKIDEDIFETLCCLRSCLKNRKLINIFNLEKADSVQDLDRAILYALLKANKSDVSSQLSLALAWNRCDIARQEIFTHENRFKLQQSQLYNAMFTALVQNRPDFVQLFLDNGVDLKRFLTIHTLWNLYCNCIMEDTNMASVLKYTISYLRQTWASFLLCGETPDFENSPELLQYISKVIVHLLENQSFNFYADRKYKVDNEDVSLEWKGDSDKVKSLSSRIRSRKSMPNFEAAITATVQGQISRRRTKMKIEDPIDFDNPERELYIWAILFNRRELTRLFWRIGTDHLGAALFGSALLYRLSNQAESEEEAELARDLSEHSDECERLALSVLSECYSRDKSLTHRLLVRELKLWGKLTLFKIAESFELMEFAEHSACQTKLSSIWKGRMALYTSEMKILLCVFLPVFVPFIKFVDDPREKVQDEDDFGEETETVGNISDCSPQHKNRVEPSSDLPDDDGDGLGFVRSQTRRKPKGKASRFKKVNFIDFSSGNINIVSAIYYFYRAPITKFFCNIVSYIAFVALFSFVVLVKLAPVNEEDSPSFQEYLTWAWLSTMILEEFRQLFMRDQRSLKYKFRSWFDNIWNRFDAAMYFLFILSIILRYELIGNKFVGARITYSITLAMFVLRFMQYFYAEKNMGPKVIMIRKMLTDLMFFFFILLVFVVSFGLAYHANMFPQAPASWSILINVLYFPYFQMYGELFIENMKGDDVDGCTRNETIWREDPYKRCPSENAVVPTLLAVYMILTNILLVNLLIAMFSYTFQTVQDNSTRVWRYYRLALVFEYSDRPTLVPPIIIFNHIFRLFRWFVIHTTGKWRKADTFEWELSPIEQKRLTLFEKGAMENHLLTFKQQSKLTLDSRVKNTAKRLDTVMEELQLIKESIQQQDISRSDLGDGNDQNELQREKELMEIVPTKEVPEAPLSRPELQPQIAKQQALEVDKLVRKMEAMETQSVNVSQRISQLAHLIETSLREQQELIQRQHPGAPSVAFHDTEEGENEGV